ncbi:integrase, catalytic region, zinc finger, CCHC-type containing protein [Tanacetum coccineum]
MQSFNHQQNASFNHLSFPTLANLSLTIPVFKHGDDPIDAINHVMSFLSAVVTSRYPTTNNQLRNSSNPRQQATINDGRVTIQPVQGRQISYAAGTTRTFTPGASRSNSGKQRIVTCYNCKGDGHMSKQCTKPRRKQDDSWFKDKVLLVQAQASGQILHEEELAFLADPGIPKAQATQTVALMANLSHYGSDALAKNSLIVDHADSLIMRRSCFKHLKHTYKDLSDSIKKTSVQTKDHANSLIVDHADSLIVQLNCKSVENTNLKAQIQEFFFANVALKNDLRKLKGNSMDTKFAKPSILGKPVLQPPKNQSVVRQLNAFKSERPNFSKPRFASQVDVNNVLSKPVTQHYLPKGRESAFAKPNHVIASSSSRNSSKDMPRFSSNDMVHNHYLEEARKKTQEKYRNSESSVMHSTRL